MKTIGIVLCLLATAFPAEPTQPRLHLPSSKVLTNVPGAPRPTNTLPTTIALSPDGRYAALLNNGYGNEDAGVRQSIAIVDLHKGGVKDFPDSRFAENALQSYFLGLAFSTDGDELYASVGSISDPIGSKPRSTGNGVAVYSFRNGSITPVRFIKIGPQQLAPDKYVAKGLFKLPRRQAIPYPAGMAVISRDGHDQLLVANNLSDNAVLLDAATGRVSQRFDLSTSALIPNAFPYTVVASKDGRRAWSSLWNGSRVAELDLENGRVTRWISLMEPKVATDPGSHPTALLLSPDESRLYVTLTNLDLIAIVETATGRVLQLLSTRLPNQEYGGSFPNALALTHDAKRLFAANAGTNSIAVFDLNAAATNAASDPAQAAGFIPTEWYPTAVAVQGEDLLIATGKGRGTGPNAPKSTPGEPHHGKKFPYIPTLLHGSVAQVKLADVHSHLTELTRSAQEQNLLLELPQKLKFASGENPIRHVIYIIKENRTYDQILGDLKVGDGDSSLVLYGEDVTPNLHRLALQFGVLDNFYDSGEVSGDGHMWSTAGTTSDYNEKTWEIAYRGNERTYDYEGLVADEYALERGVPDVNDTATGYIWGNVARHGLSYRHYGEYVASEWCEPPRRKKAVSPKEGTPSPPPATCSKESIAPGEPLPPNVGQPRGGPSPFPWPIPILLRNLAAKPELRDHFDPLFADFRMDYPDQLRADEFLREFEGFVQARADGKKDRELPNYVMLRLPNDHTAGKRPNNPTPEAAVADNDLAVGRVVDAVSHSPYWDDTAIFIIEDDAQDGPDHVDAHRSTAYIVSKYAPGSAAKPVVHHDFYTTVSVIHTMESLLGLPPMTHNDAYAPLMSPLFSGPGTQPAFNADYRNRENGLIYKMNPVRGKDAKQSAAMDFTHADSANARLLNVILWRDRKGDRPMPAPKHTVIRETEERDRD